MSSKKPNPKLRKDKSTKYLGYDYVVHLFGVLLRYTAVTSRFLMESFFWGGGGGEVTVEVWNGWC